MAAPLRKGRALAVQRLSGVAFLLVIALLVWLSVAFYNKDFTRTVDVSLDTDRIGNQLTVHADVKVRGVVVGEVELQDRAVVLGEHLGVPGGLGRDEVAEAELPPRDHEVLVGCGGHLQVDAGGRSALVELPGGVQEARAPAEGHRPVRTAREPGPHGGGGATTAYPFFADAPGLALVFRKRALHRGAAIGYHRNDADEIYYVLSGRGELTVDGVKREVAAGTAILTRPGSSHGIRQLGTDDLVILIDYVQSPKPKR